MIQVLPNTTMIKSKFLVGSLLFIFMVFCEVESINCPAGKRKVDETCVDCEPGTFSESMDSSVCTLCPEGTYSSNSGAQQCITCGVQNYQPSKGAKSCLRCLGPRFQSFQGASSCNSCLNPGWTVFDGDNPSAAVVSFRTFDIGNINPCKVCPPGLTICPCDWNSFNLNQTAYEECYMTRCGKPGSFLGDYYPCIPIENDSGYYSDGNGYRKRFTEPTATQYIHLNGTSSSDHVIRNCTLCFLGESYYIRNCSKFRDSSCGKCRKNSPLRTFIEDSKNECTLYSDTILSNCNVTRGDLLPSGVCNPCLPGTEIVEMSLSSPRCIKCPIGKYGLGGSHKCTDCENGYNATSGSSRCSAVQACSGYPDEFSPTGYVADCRSTGLPVTRIISKWDNGISIVVSACEMKEPGGFLVVSNYNEVGGVMYKMMDSTMGISGGGSTIGGFPYGTGDKLYHQEDGEGSSIRFAKILSVIPVSSKDHQSQLYISSDYKPLIDGGKLKSGKIRALVYDNLTEHLTSFIFKFQLTVDGVYAADHVYPYDFYTPYGLAVSFFRETTMFLWIADVGIKCIFRVELPISLSVVDLQTEFKAVAWLGLFENSAFDQGNTLSYQTSKLYGPSKVLVLGDTNLLILDTFAIWLYPNAHDSTMNNKTLYYVCGLIRFEDRRFIDISGMQQGRCDGFRMAGVDEFAFVDMTTTSLSTVTTRVYILFGSLENSHMFYFENSHVTDPSYSLENAELAGSTMWNRLRLSIPSSTNALANSLFNDYILTGFVRTHHLNARLMTMVSRKDKTFEYGLGVSIREIGRSAGLCDEGLYFDEVVGACLQTPVGTFAPSWSVSPTLCERGLVSLGPGKASSMLGCVECGRADYSIENNNYGITLNCMEKCGSGRIFNVTSLSCSRSCNSTGGYFFDSREGTCKLCPLGTMAMPNDDVFNQDVSEFSLLCKKCDIDNYGVSPGVCLSCPSGTIAPLPGSTRCVSSTSMSDGFFHDNINMVWGSWKVISSVSASSRGTLFVSDGFQVQKSIFDTHHNDAISWQTVASIVLSGYNFDPLLTVKYIPGMEETLLLSLNDTTTDNKIVSHELPALFHLIEVSNDESMLYFTKYGGTCIYRVSIFNVDLEQRDSWWYTSGENDRRKILTQSTDPWAGNCHQINDVSEVNGDRTMSGKLGIIRDMALMEKDGLTGVLFVSTESMYGNLVEGCSSGSGMSIRTVSLYDGTISTFLSGNKVLLPTIYSEEGLCSSVPYRISISRGMDVIYYGLNSMIHRFQVHGDPLTMNNITTSPTIMRNGIVFELSTGTSTYPQSMCVNSMGTVIVHWSSEPQKLYSMSYNSEPSIFSFTNNTMVSRTTAKQLACMGHRVWFISQQQGQMNDESLQSIYMVPKFSSSLLCRGGYKLYLLGVSSSYVCVQVGLGGFTTTTTTTTISTCPEGTFGLIAGSDSISYCKPCPKDSVATTPGQYGCNWCPASSGFTVAGRECTNNCPVGFYRKYVGSSETCEQCPLGYTSDENSIGFSSCIACRPDTYSNSSTNYKCVPCPSGYTSPEGGFECVKICGEKTCALNGKDCQDLVNGYEVITSIVLKNSVSCVLAAPSGYGVFYSDGNILGYFYDDCPSFISKDEAANDCQVRTIDLLPSTELKRSIMSMTMETSFSNLSLPLFSSHVARYLYVATQTPTCSIYKIPILYMGGSVDEVATSNYLSENQEGSNQLRKWLFVGAERCLRSQKDGFFNEAIFGGIADIQLTSDGSYLYVADITGSTIRLVTMKTGFVQTILGNPSSKTWKTGSMPTPISGLMTGYALANSPNGIGIDDLSGTVYLTMRSLHQVGRFNMVDVLRGNSLTTTFESFCGYSGLDSTKFWENATVIIDGSSCDPSSRVSCYLFRPFDVVVYDSNVIVSVQEGLVGIDRNTLKCTNVGGKIWDNTQNAIGYKDGDESESMFSSPLRLSVATDRGILYIADRLNKAVRRIFISGKCKCPQGSMYLHSARTCYDPTPSSGSKTTKDCAFGHFSLETEDFCRPCEEAFGLKLNIATCIMWKKTQRPRNAVGYSFSKIQANPFPVLERMSDWYGGPFRNPNNVPWNDIFARDSSIMYSLGSVNGHAPYGLDFVSMTFVYGVACDQQDQYNGDSSSGEGCWMLETRPSFMPQIILPGMWYPCNDNEMSMKVESSKNLYTCSCPWNLAEFGSPQETTCKTPTWNCLRLAAVENQARALGSNDDLPLNLQEYMKGGQAWNDNSQQRVESWSRFVILGTDESARRVICKDLEYGRGPCFPYFKHIRQQTALNPISSLVEDNQNIQLVSSHKWHDEPGITNLKCGVGWPSHYYCPDGYMWVAPNTTSIDRTNTSKTIYAARGSNSLGAAPVITCLSCLPGTFSRVVLSVKVVKGGPYQCNLCRGGTYSSSVGASTCRFCPDNTFSANEIGSSSCSQCPVNYYSFAGSWSSHACTPCKPGTGSCRNCSAGYFQNQAAQNECVACPKGTFTRVASQAKCELCDFNTYQPSTGQQGCFPCELGTFASLKGQSSCMSCSSESLSNCSLTVNQTCGQGCGINFYWNIESLSCVRCASGFLNAFSTCAKSPTICQDAQDGSKFILSKRDAEMGGDILGECPSGSGSTLSGFMQCEYCREGEFSDIEQNTLGCKLCPPGYFSNSSNSTFCYQCIPGTVTTAQGKVSCDQCGAGEYMGENGGSACMKCAAGSFSVGTGQTVCILCSNGTYGSDTGRVSDCVDQCDGSQGYYSGRGATVCTYCDMGQVSLQNCVGCGKGMYVHLSTFAGDQQECRFCPNGTYNDWTDHGVNATPTCKECPVVHYADSSRIRCVSANPGYVPDISRTTEVACPRGTFRGINDTLCIACPAGSFQSATGKTSCILCSKGTAQSMSGQVMCTQCSRKLVALEPGNVQCYSCPDGHRYNSNSECKICEINTYMTPDKGSCVQCPEGKVSKRGSANIMNCTRCDPYLVLENGMCIQCTPGKYSVGREYTIFHTGERYTAYSCVSCPLGTQNPYFGSTSIADCKPCDIVGYVPASNQSMCVSCLPGQTADPTSYVCKNCEPGKFSPTGAVCIPCAAGFFTSFNSSVSCLPCGSGTYSNVTGASTCSLCQPGTYSNQSAQQDNGTVSCSLCTSSLGYSNTFGATKCTPRKTHCDVGQFLVLQVEDPTLDHACASCEFCSPSQYTVAASIMQNSIDPVIDMMNSGNSSSSSSGGLSFMELYCPGNEIRPRYRCENNVPVAGQKLVFNYGNTGTGGTSTNSGGPSGLSMTTNYCDDIDLASMTLVGYVTGFDARYCYVGCRYGYKEAGIAAYRERYGISNGIFEDTKRNIFSPRMLEYSKDICLQCPTSACPLGRYRPLGDVLSSSCGPSCFLNTFLRGCEDAPNGCIGLCVSPPNNSFTIDGSSVLGNQECPWQCNDKYFLNNENSGCMSCENQISCPDGFAPIPTSECRPQHKLIDLCKRCNHVDGGVAYAYDMRYQSCVYHCSRGTHYPSSDNTNCFPCLSTNDSVSCPYGEYLDVESCQRYGVPPVCKECFLHNDTVGKISFLSNGGTNATGCRAICGVGYNSFYRIPGGGPVLLNAKPFTSDLKCVLCDSFTTTCKGRCSFGFFRNLSVADGYPGTCVACKKSFECDTGQYAPACTGNETADVSCRPCNISLLYNSQKEIVKVFVPYTYRFINELQDGMKCPTMCKINMVWYNGACINCNSYVNDVLKCKEETKSAIYYAVGQPKPCDFIYSHWNATDDTIWWNDPAYTPSFMKSYLSNSLFLTDPLKKIYRRVGPVCWPCPMGSATSEERMDKDLCQILPGFGTPTGTVTQTTSISIPSIPSSSVQIYLSNREPRRKILTSTTTSSTLQNSRRLLLDLRSNSQEFSSAISTIAATGTFPFFVDTVKPTTLNGKLSFIQCPIGTYNDRGTECKRCPNGTSTKYTRSLSISSCLCLPGYRRNISSLTSANNPTMATSCIPCGLNMYKPLDDLLDTKCYPCSTFETTFDKYDATRCACIPGYYRRDSSSGKCEPCPPNYACVSCYEGEIQSCPAEGVHRLECFSNSISNIHSTSIENCSCTNGTVKLRRRLVLETSIILSNGGGYTLDYEKKLRNNYYCMAAPPNSIYNPVTKTLSCKRGWREVWGKAIVLGDVDILQFCYLCNPGEYADVDPSIPSPVLVNGKISYPTMKCLKCPKGSYSDSPVVVGSCTSCPKNTTTTKEGSKTKNQCGCTPPQVLASDNQTCVGCRGNEYRSENATCISCPSNSIANSGASSIKDCVCIAGYTLHPSSFSLLPIMMTFNGCVPCPKGSYSTIASNSNCTICPMGSSTAGVASASLADCNVCSPGYCLNAVGQRYACVKIGLLANVKAGSDGMCTRIN